MIGQNIDISPEVMALSEDPSTIYGLEVSDEAEAPDIRLGDYVIVCGATRPKPGDRIVIDTGRGRTLAILETAIPPEFDEEWAPESTVAPAIVFNFDGGRKRAHADFHKMKAVHRVIGVIRHDTGACEPLATEG